MNIFHIKLFAVFVYILLIVYNPIICYSYLNSNEICISLQTWILFIIIHILWLTIKLTYIIINFITGL